MKKLISVIRESLWQDFINTESTNLPPYARRLYGSWNRPEFNHDDIAEAAAEAGKWFDEVDKELLKITEKTAGTNNMRRWPFEYSLMPNAEIYGCKLSVVFNKRVIKSLFGIVNKDMGKLLMKDFDNVESCYNGWYINIPLESDKFKEVHNKIVEILGLEKADLSNLSICLDKLNNAFKNYSNALTKHGIPLDTYV